MGSAAIAAYQFCPGFSSYCVCAAARWVAAAISPTTMVILAQELIIVVCSSLQNGKRKKKVEEKKRKIVKPAHAPGCQKKGLKRSGTEWKRYIYT